MHLLKKSLLPLAAALCLSWAAAAQSVADLDTKFGFRDVKFETDTSAIEGLAPAESTASKYTATRPADVRKVGKATINSITYGFFEGKLYEVTLVAKGLTNSHALRRLRVEYLDLYFCHRPDEHTPTEETVRAMHDLIQQGKVLYWGTSEWTAQQIQEAYGIARELRLTPPTMEQPQYHLLHRKRVEAEYRRLYDRNSVGLGLTTWSPLGSGLLTGKYNDGIPPGSRLADNDDLAWLRERITGPEGQENIRKVRRLGALAAELGIPQSRLALAWCLKNPHVGTVITGASRVEQVRENMRALDAVPLLTEEVLARVEEIVGNKPTITTF